MLYYRQVRKQTRNGEHEMTHQITVQSIAKNNEIEWQEIVIAGNKSAATRKANSIILSCGMDEIVIEKTTNQYDESIETWRLK